MFVVICGENVLVCCVCMCVCVLHQCIASSECENVVLCCSVFVFCVGACVYCLLVVVTVVFFCFESPIHVLPLLTIHFCLFDGEQWVSICAADVVCVCLLLFVERMCLYVVCVCVCVASVHCQQ